MSVAEPPGASGERPGVLGALARLGALPTDAPGLDALAGALPGGWARFVTRDGRIDQAGWPCAHDVALACRAARRLGPAGAFARAALDEVEAWLAGRLDGAALEVRRRAVFAAALGAELGARGTSAAEALPVLAALHLDAGPRGRRRPGRRR